VLSYQRRFAISGDYPRHHRFRPRCDRPGYPEAVAAWATSEAQCALLRRHLAEVGIISPETAEPRPAALTWLRTYERLAAEHRATLGLDPRSEASLAKERAAAATLAVDLQALSGWR
jgi:hypothetical protein